MTSRLSELPKELQDAIVAEGLKRGRRLLAFLFVNRLGSILVFRLIILRTGLIQKQIILHLVLCFP